MIVNDSNLAWYNAIMGQKQEGPLYKMKPQACQGDTLSGFFHAREDDSLDADLSQMPPLRGEASGRGNLRPVQTDLPRQTG